MAQYQIKEENKNVENFEELARLVKNYRSITIEFRKHLGVDAKQAMTDYEKRIDLWLSENIEKVEPKTYEDGEA